MPVVIASHSAEQFPNKNIAIKKQNKKRWNEQKTVFGMIIVLSSEYYITRGSCCMTGGIAGDCAQVKVRQKKIDSKAISPNRWEYSKIPFSFRRKRDRRIESWTKLKRLPKEKTCNLVRTDWRNATEFRNPFPDRTFCWCQSWLNDNPNGLYLVAYRIILSISMIMTGYNCKESSKMTTKHVNEIEMEFILSIIGRWCDVYLTIVQNAIHTEMLQTLR